MHKEGHSRGDAPVDLVMTGWNRAPALPRVTSNDNGGNNNSHDDPSNDSALFYSGNKCQSIAFADILPSPPRVPFTATFVGSIATKSTPYDSCGSRALMRSIWRDGLRLSPTLHREICSFIFPPES
ncbi:unnamed protein product [Lasius platythorax]|uniref:Uncharacterized protein n=1 Tax=Lasius platythorax TaxID=488582 RepID=A0AAV2NTE5_9HYME